MLVEKCQTNARSSSRPQSPTFPTLLYLNLLPSLPCPPLPSPAFPLHDLKGPTPCASSYLHLLGPHSNTPPPPLLVSFIFPALMDSTQHVGYAAATPATAATLCNSGDTSTTPTPHTHLRVLSCSESMPQAPRPHMPTHTHNIHTTFLQSMAHL